MLRNACLALMMTVSTVYAQLGATPAERFLLPAPTLDPPLFADEIDVTTDLDALRLNGDISMIEMRQYASRDLNGELVVDLVIRMTFDACGNLETMSMSDVWDGVEQAGETLSMRSTYEADCFRTAISVVPPDADPDEPAAGTIEYDADQKLVAYDPVIYRVRFERMEDALVSASVTNSYGETKVFEFHPETQRLTAIVEDETRVEADWVNDREVRLGNDTMGWFVLALDERNNHTVVVMPEPDGMFGHSWLKAFEYDDHGNWTAMSVSNAKAEGAEPSLYQRYTRVITYRD